MWNEAKTRRTIIGNFFVGLHKIHKHIQYVYTMKKKNHEVGLPLESIFVWRHANIKKRHVGFCVTFIWKEDIYLFTQPQRQKCSADECNWIESNYLIEEQ